MNKAKLKRFVWNNKEGILIGGLVGYLFSRFFLPDYINLNTIIQTQGLIDIITSSSGIELAERKIRVAFTVIGATIGMVIDMNLKEGWYRKWL